MINLLLIQPENQEINHFPKNADIRAIQERRPVTCVFDEIFFYSVHL